MDKKSMQKFKQRIREEELPMLRQDIKTLQKIADYVERNINNVTSDNIRQFERDIERMEDSLTITNILG